MSCLDIQIKLAMMMDQIGITKKMLKEDSIRPATKERLEEELNILRKDVKQLYFDLFKIISN
jgi:hypothetical protein